MTEPTEQTASENTASDYTHWTFEDHLNAAVTLAAKADDLAVGHIPSQAAVQREQIRQTAARAMLHARIAELKKPAPEATLLESPVGPAVDVKELAAELAAAMQTRPQPRQQKAGARDAGQ